ncbi:hypothetical protein [Rheinheimera nanhaiensis]|uniref:Uncharacterized protein n=1 Tax=Rheinheimera nanhaiensis E407-8 TaxID=562729 RepID=I1DZ76_9GAMM|nr:hypothetical protein [Rheinheimera nanhaiensis]GAB59354.1 hypothetical protein RNAN_2356 [Rheinheimera nanhaiensis E407-8]
MLLLLLLSLSLQALSLSVPADERHLSASSSHQLLHFLAEPHTHDEADPTVITLGFSAEAREHVACDAHSCSLMLFHDSPLSCDLLHSAPDFSYLQFLPDPFLQRTTPPPRA